MKKSITTIGIILTVIIIIPLTGNSLCSSRHLDSLKKEAPYVWREQGFEVVAYEGYRREPLFFNNYGGASVWHRLRKIPDNGITYSGCIGMWGTEIHVYGPYAVEAISPK
jgi:hypothetical protein